MDKFLLDTSEGDGPKYHTSVDRPLVLCLSLTSSLRRLDPVRSSSPLLVAGYTRGVSFQGRGPLCLPWFSSGKAREFGRKKTEKGELSRNRNLVSI